MPDKPVISNRPWVTLPELGPVTVRARLDNTVDVSRLHTLTLETYQESGRQFTRFRLSTAFGRDPLQVERTVLRMQEVVARDGSIASRPVIETDVEVEKQRFRIELLLLTAEEMLHHRFLQMALALAEVNDRFEIREANPALSATLQRAIELSFAPAEIPVALDVLEMCDHYGEREKAVVAANGRLETLESFVECDWRDFYSWFGDEFSPDYIPPDEDNARRQRLGLTAPTHSRRKPTLDERVLEFLHERTRVPRGTFDMSTHLQDRFRFSRDEARDLIDQFAQHFRVDMRQFPFDRYFPPQPGEHLLRDTFSRLFGRGERPAEPLTAQHLVDAARRKYWQEPAPA